MSLIQKRLNLLYPNKHTLQAVNKNEKLCSETDS
jgi:hypothetical protein